MDRKYNNESFPGTLSVFAPQTWVDFIPKAALVQLSLLFFKILNLQLMVIVGW